MTGDFCSVVIDDPNSACYSLRLQCKASPADERARALEVFRRDIFSFLCNGHPLQS